MEPYLPFALPIGAALSAGVGVLLLVSCCRGGKKKVDGSKKLKDKKKQAKTSDDDTADAKGKETKEPAKNLNSKTTQNLDAKIKAKSAPKPKAKKKEEKPLADQSRWSALAVEEGESEEEEEDSRGKGPVGNKGKGKGKAQQGAGGGASAKPAGAGTGAAGAAGGKGKAPAKAQNPLSKFYHDHDNDHEEEGEEEGEEGHSISKSARRRLNAKNKSQEVGKHGAIVDGDGFVSVVDPKKARKAMKAEDNKGYKAAFSHSSSSSSYSAAPASSDDGEKAEVEVDPKHYGLLIGEKGATLLRLQQGTGTTIEIPKKDSGVKKVIIRGPKENVQTAKAAISSLVQKGFSTVTHPGHVCSEITVSSLDVAIVVGPEGKHIKALQQAYAVRINTPDRKSGSSKLVISGPKDEVRKAKDAVNSLKHHGFSAATHPGWVMDELTFPREAFNILIGPGGQTIKSIQGDTRTKVNVPDIANPNQNLVIVGPAEGVKRAKVQVARLLTKEQELMKQVKYAKTQDEEEEEEDIDDEARQYLVDDFPPQGQSQKSAADQEDSIWG